MDENTAPDTGIALPEDLKTLNAKDLGALKSKILKAAEKYKGKEGLSADDLAVVAALVEQMNVVRAQETENATAAQETSAKAGELFNALNGDETTDEQPETDTAEPAEGDNVTDLPTIEEPTQDAPVTVESLAAAIVTALTAATPVATAPARTTPRGTIGDTVAATRTTAIPTPGSNVTITAAAGIDRVQMGSTLTRDELSSAMHEKARMLKDDGSQHLVASIAVTKPKNDIRSLRADTEISAVWQKAHEVPERGLVASGGWCAPSETVYDFVCDFEAMPETVDVPTITANRGGLRYPISPTLGDVIADPNYGFTWTEANDIAAAEPGGPTKPCLRIPCPDFAETRLQADGLCVTNGNLMDRAYPELTSRYLDLVMTANAHRINSLVIAKMVANSTAIPSGTTPVSAAEALLGTLELRIAQNRDRWFMSADATLEVVLPRWTRSIIRRDLARRSGFAFEQVSNQMIGQFFTEIGARVQFVSNYQTLPNNTDDTYPVSVQVMYYLPGAHTRLDGGSLDIGVTRDSVQNSTNDYTLAFTESFWGLVTRCASYVETVEICASGFSSLPVAVACPTA